jgi:hypothetical protein
VLTKPSNHRLGTSTATHMDADIKLCLRPRAPRCVHRDQTPSSSPHTGNPVHRRRQVQTHQTLRTLPLTPCHAPEASPWPSTFAPATSSKKPTTESSPTTTQPHPRIRAITKFVSDRFVWPNHSNIDATSVASTLAARCISRFGTSLRLATSRA